MKQLLSKKAIFFRDDDAAEVTDNLVRLINIFHRHEVPLHLSVIPGQLTEECAHFIRVQMRESGGLIEIGQHGYIHKNYSTSGNRFAQYEFGENRTFEQQRADILKGREILHRHFGRRIDIFTPPWHGFDKNTICILSDEKFLGLSGVYNKVLPTVENRLDYIPVHMNFNKIKASGEWYTEQNCEILKYILLCKEDHIGLLMHHKAFNCDEEFRQLERLLQSIKRIGVADCIALSEVLGKQTHTKPILEHAAFFLHYQFVPKPLTITKTSTNPVYPDYDFDYSDHPKLLNTNEAQICDDLYATFKMTLEQQLPANGKSIGLLLSGGLNSAAILHTLREITDRKIYTLTSAYQSNASHVFFAKKLSLKYGTIHDTLIIAPENLQEIDNLYKAGIPQPFGDHGLISAYLMTKRLNEKTTNIFSGEGADCLFGSLHRHLLNPAEKNTGANEHDLFDEVFINPEELTMLFEGPQQFNLAMPFAKIAQQIKTQNPMKRQVLLDLNFVVKHRADYLHHISSANGVQIHLPYLNKTFIDFALSIPSELLINSIQQQENILMKTFKDRIRAEIRGREKEGFVPPFKQWFYHNKEYLVQKLKQARKLGISRQYIIYLIKNIKHSDRYRMGMKIWLLLNLVSWYEQHE